MSVWTERVASSKIVERLGALGPVIENARQREDNTPETRESLARLHAVLSFIGRRIDGADSALIRGQVLEQVGGSIEAVTSLVQLFVQDGQVAHLDEAHNNIDVGLGAFAGIIFPSSTDDVRGLRREVDAYRESVGAHFRDLEKAAAARREDLIGLDAALADARKAFVQETNNLTTDVAAFRSAIKAAQDTLTAEYAAVQKRLEEGLNLKIAEWQTSFDAAEKARNDEHKSESAGQTKTFDGLIERCETTLRGTDATWAHSLADLAKKYEADEVALKTRYEETAASKLATIEANLVRVQELVGAIGDHGVTAGFKREADDARSEVIYWQRVTFWSMFFLILVGIATAFHVFESKLTWISLASRLYLSIATGVLAGYAASQASRYQQRERRNRKLELELRALGPFLEPVETTEREKFRLKIAEVFFGKDDGISDRPGPATALQGSKETFEKVLELLKTALEKLPGKG